MQKTPSPRTPSRFVRFENHVFASSAIYYRPKQLARNIHSRFLASHDARHTLNSCLLHAWKRVTWGSIHFPLSYLQEVWRRRSEYWCLDATPYYVSEVSFVVLSKTFQYISGRYVRASTALFMMRVTRARVWEHSRPLSIMPRDLGHAIEERQHPNKQTSTCHLM